MEVIWEWAKTWVCWAIAVYCGLKLFAASFEDPKSKKSNMWLLFMIIAVFVDFMLNKWMYK